MRMYRQGDVLLTRTLRRPSAQAVPVGLVLAYGEVTGHAHRVHDGAVTDATDSVPAQELFEEPDGTRLLVVRREADVRHEEHGAIALAPGTYEVIRQREYHPQAIRSVAD